LGLAEFERYRNLEEFNCLFLLAHGCLLENAKGQTPGGAGACPLIPTGLLSLAGWGVLLIIDGGHDQLPGLGPADLECSGPE
jgi:hypothetical protein